MIGGSERLFTRQGDRGTRTDGNVRLLPISAASPRDRPVICAPALRYLPGVLHVQLGYCRCYLYLYGTGAVGQWRSGHDGRNLLEYTETNSDEETVTWQSYGRHLRENTWLAEEKR